MKDARDFNPVSMSLYHVRGILEEALVFEARAFFFWVDKFLFSLLFARSLNIIYFAVEGPSFIFADFTFTQTVFSVSKGLI